MAASDAKPFPIKNTAYRVYFPILDADGDLVTGATGLDSEDSIDGATFTDCTNEATEIATSSGIYYLDLTAAEMNSDCTVIIVKTSTSGAKTTVLALYPVDTGDIDVDVTAFGGTAGTFASGRPEVNTTHAAGTAWGSGAITAGAIAADAITAAKIADGAIDTATFATGCTIPRVTLCDTLTTYTSNTPQTGDAYARIGLAGAGLTSLASATNLATLAGYVDTEVAAIKAVTDQMAFGTANRLNVQVYGVETAAVTAIQSGLSTLTTSQVNAEVVDALATDTYAEPGQGAPAATASLATKIGMLHKFLRNKITQTSTTLNVYADDGTTVDHKSTVSDDGTTYTRGEIASGP